MFTNSSRTFRNAINACRSHFEPPPLRGASA